ncbi:hypothetical protein MJG53_010954 [Ovis ammon polii x Ovis aries]|uniref:Uncharacterized protein n=1 Tax=Ovis ammon polii x Ovis aries TaxID=2918886 RepID=A0ACB9URB0_9CETA|nr:hypothetical protein MJG53_010954 [Ovis ammon polii x Ovis aries]
MEGASQILGTNDSTLRQLKPPHPSHIEGPVSPRCLGLVTYLNPRPSSLTIPRNERIKATPDTGTCCFDLGQFTRTSENHSHHGTKTTVEGTVDSEPGGECGVKYPTVQVCEGAAPSSQRFPVCKTPGLPADKQLRKGPGQDKMCCYTRSLDLAHAVQDSTITTDRFQFYKPRSTLCTLTWLFSGRGGGDVRNGEVTQERPLQASQHILDDAPLDQLYDHTASVCMSVSHRRLLDITDTVICFSSALSTWPSTTRT